MKTKIAYSTTIAALRSAALSARRDVGLGGSGWSSISWLSRLTKDPAPLQFTLLWRNVEAATTRTHGCGQIAKLNECAACSATGYAWVRSRRMIEFNLDSTTGLMRIGVHSPKGK